MRGVPSIVIFIGALLSTACSSDGGGAIVVRWQLVDRATGGEPASCESDVGDGCCGLIETRDRLRKAVCIDQMRLSLFRFDSDDGGVTTDGGAMSCATCSFGCDPLEHATSFDIAPGNYRIALEPMRKGKLIGRTPPATVRSLRRGQVTDLNSIEIQLDPDEASCNDP